MRTVLVLGGYGFFGQRISAALASTLPPTRTRIDGVEASAASRSMGLPAENGVALVPSTKR